MAGSAVKTRRERGSIRKRGGSFQVIVFAGQDPITGKQSYLRGTAKNERDAERLRVKLRAQVNAQRSTVTRVSLAYALDAWLENHEAAQTTIDGYRGYMERTIKPALGDRDVPIVNLSARKLELFYGQLRRCRARCNGKPYVEHRVASTHECRGVRHTRVRRHDCVAAKCRVLECRRHECVPMSPSTVRQIHAVISGALNCAVRWDWIPENPASVAKKPRQANPQPKPPTAEQAARIVEAAWAQDDDWGMLVWLAMMTGARRGELLALRWPDLHWDAQILEIRRSFTLRAGQAIEKDTKTHQRPCNPDSVGHRYVKKCAGLGIDTHLYALRHYSATEMGAGVDLRTVAGRLGHGGGGVTTLRVYAAWVAESDKRAAQLLVGKVAPPRRSGQAPD